MKEKKRVLCLDVGDKKIGVAVSDPSGKTGLSLTTIQRRGFLADCGKIFEILKEYQAAKIVLGLPLNTEHQEGLQARKVRFFSESLEKYLRENGAPVEITLFDESFSSKEAERILLKGDLSRKKRGKVIDKVAASLILQGYLDEEDD